MLTVAPDRARPQAGSHRIWAVESAGGLGYLLAQQLLAAGETVVDIPATLASRARLLGPVAVERHGLAVDLLDELDRLAGKRRAVRDRIRTAIAACGTTLTDIFGVGEVIAATIIGHTGDIARFPTADWFAAYNGTGPIEWSSENGPRGTRNGPAAGCPAAGTAPSTTPSTSPP